MGRCVRGVERGVGNVLGEEKCGQKWRVWENVGRGLGSVKKGGVGAGGKSVPHLSPHLFRPPPHLPSEQYAH